MILEVLSTGLVITACLAIFLDDAIYSVVALSGTFLFTSALYALSGAVFVAVFQFAVGAGTLAVLFLSGEMLSEKSLKKTRGRNLLGTFVAGVLLSLPPIFLSISTPTNDGPSVSFGEALWSLRAGDIALQGLVVMTVALGIAILLYEKKKGAK